MKIVKKIEASSKKNPTPLGVFPRSHCSSFSKLEKVRDYVYSKLEDIRSIKEKCGLQFLPNYNVFKKLYAKAKEKVLGYVKLRRNRSWAVSPKIRRLQEQIRKATLDVKRTKSDLEIFKLQNLEKIMKNEYYREKNEQFCA